MESSDEYEESRADLRLRFRWFWTLFVLYLPVGILALRIYMVPAIAYAWMALVTVAGLRVAFFRCPRCGDVAFWTGYRINALTKACLNCSLRIR